MNFWPVLTLFAATAATPLVAQQAQSFSLPAGCNGYVTVQKRGCVVSHLFTCQGDPVGYQRRVDMVEDALTYLGTIDAETQWIESSHIAAGRTEQLLPGATDPASFTDLLATGRDTWDFMVQDDLGLRTHNVGSDEIVDASVSIDGVTLQMTAFTIRATDPDTGVELWRGTGHEYIHPDWRTFLSGIRTITDSTGTFDTDNTPVEFAFPGEDGFLTSKPRYDCSVAISANDPEMTFVSATRN